MKYIQYLELFILETNVNYFNQTFVSHILSIAESHIVRETWSGILYSRKKMSN